MKQYLKKLALPFSLCLVGTFTNDHDALLRQLNDDETVKRLQANPYLKYQPDLARRIFHAVFSAPDSLARIIAANEFDARIIFDSSLEHGLALRYAGQYAAADSFLSVAEKLSDHWFAHSGDERPRRRYNHFAGLSLEEMQLFAQANAAFLKGLEFTRSENVADSMAWLRKALALARRLNDVTKEIDALQQLSYCYNNFGGDYLMALRCAQKAQALSLKNHYALGAFYASITAGRCNTMLLNASEAENAFAAAYAIAESLHFEIGLERVMESHIALLYVLGRYPEALELAHRQLALSEKLHDGHGAATGTSWTAQLYSEMGNFGQALRYLNLAVARYTTLHNHQALGHIYSQLATIYYELDLPDSALAACDQAFLCYEKMNNPEQMAQALSYKGLMYKHDRQTALALQRRALKLLPSSQSTLANLQILTNLGKIAAEFGDFDEAKSAYHELCKIAVRQKNRVYQAQGYVGLGYVHLKHSHYDSAGQHLQQGLSLAQQANSTQLIWQAQYGLARVNASIHRNPAARQYFEAAMATLQTIRRSIDRLDLNISYYGRVQEVFDDAIGFFAHDAHDSAAAFATMERAKAQNILDLFSRKRESTRTRSLFVALPPDGSEGSPDPVLHVVPSESIRVALPTGTAIIEYRISREMLWIACLTKTGLALRSLPIRSSTLDSLVKSYRRSIGADDFEAFWEKANKNPALTFHESEKLSKKLYEILIAPSADLLRGVKQLVIVVDGSLSYLPFASLKAPVHKENEFLLHDYVVAYAPSATVWHILSTENAGHAANHPNNALLLALDSPGIPFARKEVVRLAEGFADATVWTSKTFDKNELKDRLRSRWAYLHFATHAQVHDDQPLYSFLALAEDYQHPERQLFLSEILQLDFSATRLVTLSACETALGRITSGEGMMGLTQAFLCAGAAALLTSLWQVDDERTHRLMTDFYHQLMDERLSPAAALRQAQLAMIEDLSKRRPRFPFPYLWAPFILTGNGLYSPFTPNGPESVAKSTQPNLEKNSESFISPAGR
jgi:CHAT domain-containing protein/tetratricopeptide (TPR) repeat protein